MLHSLLLLIIGIPFFIGITFFAYKNFETYEPKVLKQIEEVRGIKDETGLLIPYPRGSQKIGLNKTSEGEQVTFQTNLNLQQVQDFYKNVFYENGWTMESDVFTDSFLMTEFKSKYNEVTLKATLEPELDVSIVTIKVAKRD